jgi:hypothetical protein
MITFSDVDIKSVSCESSAQEGEDAAQFAKLRSAANWQFALQLPATLK